MEDKENINEDELFYKTICKKYVGTMNKEMLLEINNEILYVFIEDKYINLKDAGKININNYKKYLEEDYSEFHYKSYSDLFFQVIKDNIRYDLNDLGVFDLDDKWDFYLTFEELRKIGFGDIVKDNYPLIQEYGVSKENITDFFNHFTLEQLNLFEETLRYYFKEKSIVYDERCLFPFYSIENYSFDINILKLACGMKNYNDFIGDYKNNGPIKYDVISTKATEYFKEKNIETLKEYAEDFNESLYHLTDLYKDLLDKLNISYTYISTVENEPGEFTTLIEFNKNNSISVSTKSHDSVEYVIHNLNTISSEYKNFMQQENEKAKNEFDYEIN